MNTPLVTLDTLDHINSEAQESVTTARATVRALEVALDRAKEALQAAECHLVYTSTTVKVAAKPTSAQPEPGSVEASEIPF